MVRVILDANQVIAKLVDEPRGRQYTGGITGIRYQKVTKLQVMSIIVRSFYSFCVIFPDKPVGMERTPSGRASLLVGGRSGLLRGRSIQGDDHLRLHEDLFLSFPTRTYFFSSSTSKVPFLTLLSQGKYLLYVSKSIIETKICQESCFLQKHMVYSCHENTRPGRYSDNT